MISNSEQFPNAETLHQKFLDSGIKGRFPILDGVIDQFIQQIADQEKEGEGLFNEWTLALEQALPKDTPKPIANSVKTNFISIVHMVASNPLVREQAIAAYHR